jgi:hypothetical protein
VVSNCLAELHRRGVCRLILCMYISTEGLACAAKCVSTHCLTRLLGNCIVHWAAGRHSLLGRLSGVIKVPSSKLCTGLKYVHFGITLPRRHKRSL